MGEKVILVDRKDRQVGMGEKLETHLKGRLHRALSIFVFNSKGELMLQRRALGKYHCGGLWSNTVCSHPRPGEKIGKAVHRRLKEELGFDTPLHEVFSFIYRVKFANGLTEYEFDHFFFGRFDGKPKPNPKEVCDWKWINLKDLRKDVNAHPKKYTYWFMKALPRFKKYLGKSAPQRSKV